MRCLVVLPLCRPTARGTSTRDEQFRTGEATRRKRRWQTPPGERNSSPGDCGVHLFRALTAEMDGTSAALPPTGCKPGESGDNLSISADPGMRCGSNVPGSFCSRAERLAAQAAQNGSSGGRFPAEVDHPVTGTHQPATAGVWKRSRPDRASVDGPRGSPRKVPPENCQYRQILGRNLVPLPIGVTERPPTIPSRLHGVQTPLTKKRPLGPLPWSS